MTANSIAISRRLAERGMDKTVADAVAEEIVDFSNENAATNADLARVEANLKADNARIEAKFDAKFNMVIAKFNIVIAINLALLSAFLVDKIIL